RKNRLLAVSTKRRIQSIVLESIRIENPEYVDDVASKITKMIYRLVEDQNEIPERERFLQKGSGISTQFFKHNKINRREFLVNLHERIKDIEIEYTTQQNQQYRDWEEINEMVGFSRNLQLKILRELKNLRKEQKGDVEDMMKVLLLLQKKTAIAGSELESVKKELETLILIQIAEKNRKPLLDRIKSWSTEVGLGVIGNLLYDILRIIG
ncbi:MAG: hypothetical protein P1Q69_13555, partial [Candidatus Thorarchaeota archaeon]|nr:hypothetical protein [Candidatus Thorarchaeota archaeon]